MMYRVQGGSLQSVFFAGNGQAPNLAAGFANVYLLNTAKLTDDDYGQIYPYYTLAFLPTVEAAQGTGLGGLRNILAYLTAYVSGLGTLTVTPLIDNLTNTWPIVGTRDLSANPNFDLEWAGGSATGQRMALQFSSAPPVGVVSTLSTGNVVTWVSGATFAGLASGGSIVINSVTYTIANSPAVTPTSLALTTSPGNQANVAWGLPTPDNSFLLQRVLALLRRVTHMPVRGSSF